MARPVPALDLTPEDARKTAYATGLRLLAGREMSTARLRERLLGRGLPGEAVEQALTRLTGAGALDDARAARAAARVMLTVKLRGRHRVAREMERLGFPPAIAQAAMAEVLAGSDERGALARLIAARMRGRARIADPAAYRRLFAALLRRGFAADAVREALRPHWGKGSPPIEPDGD